MRIVNEITKDIIYNTRVFVTQIARRGERCPVIQSRIKAGLKCTTILFDEEKECYVFKIS